ncbi:hypothetical protein ABIA24_006310 [Sinorhizobium fredii]|nr:hypothetical protein SF83666_b62100 [Sinorhizobium fredii CCBAU 83666]
MFAVALAAARWPRARRCQTNLPPGTGRKIKTEKARRAFIKAAEEAHLSVRSQ